MHRSTCVIITNAHSAWFQRFLQPEDPTSRRRPNQSGKRGDPAYTALKAKIKDWLLATLYRHFPRCEGRVEYMEVGTPLTNLHYFNRTDSYGLEHTPAHYGGPLNGMRPETNIPGLFVTGQDVTTMGVVGALFGGILTTQAVLGYGFWDLVVAKRNLLEDMVTMIKTAAYKKGHDKDRGKDKDKNKDK